MLINRRELDVECRIRNLAQRLELRSESVEVGRVDAVERLDTQMISSQEEWTAGEVDTGAGKHSAQMMYYTVGLPLEICVREGLGVRAGADLVTGRAELGREVSEE